MKFFLVLLLIAIASAPAVQAQQDAGSMDAMVDKIIRRERAVTEDLEGLHPIVETYIQNLKSENGQLVLLRDHYFLSQAEFSGQLRALRFKQRGLELNRTLGESLDSARPNSLEFVPSGFVAMAYPDPSTFDRAHYRFDVQAQESLGEVHCYVFDVHPISFRQSGLFEGRIWVEDQQLTIVRFKGHFRGSNFYSKYFHFDSLRTNTSGGRWVPADVYSEETDLPCCGFGKFQWTKIRFRSQTHFWGYNLHFARSQDEFTRIVVDPASNVTDRLEAGPADQQIAWERQAQQNVVDKLEQIGLMAPAGELEKSLDQIVGNIEKPNNITMDPPIQCRVLLTTTLESAVVGHTLLLSRGLIDVLPDEATLAAVLANGLAIAALEDRGYREHSFNDQLMFEAREAMRHLHFAHSEVQEAEANSMAEVWMKKSSYGNSLDSVLHFAAEVRIYENPLNHLLEANIGDGVSKIFRPGRAEYASGSPGRVRASNSLPLGSRITVDPWTDQISLVRNSPTGVIRRDHPFEVTPTAIYLRRAPESRFAASPSVINRE